MNLSSIIKKYKKFDFSLFSLHKSYKYSTSVQISSDVNEVLSNSKKIEYKAEKELESVH